VARIPIPDNINPGSLQGDRLAYSGADLSGPGRALQGFGRAVTGLAEEWKANAGRMNKYNTNLALEKWSTEQTIGYEQDLATSSPDGSDFIPKREKNLIDSYNKVRKGITDPELAATADMVFERTRGNQVIRGMQDTKGKARNYVLATTNDSVDSVFQSGALKTEDQFNDYFDNVISPRIKSVIDDPLEQQRFDDIFRKRLREEHFRVNPAAAAQQEVKVSGDDYYARLAKIESGGNPNARNPSGAAGLYQFMPATARQYGLTNPFDPQASQVAVEKLTADNRAYLKGKLGREPSPGELYLAHQQGAGGAVKLLANPNASAASVVGRQAVIQNGGSEGMTAGEFANKWISKFEGTSAPKTQAVSPSMPQGGIFTGMDQSEWDGYVKRSRDQYAEVITSTVPDELTSLTFNGEYTGREPLTRSDFVAAYGADGEAKFEEYEGDRMVAMQKYAYKDMPSDQILADINSRKEEIGTGEGAARNIQDFAELEKTAKAIIDYRDARRAEYLTDVERRRVAASNRQIDIANTRDQRFATMQKEKAASIVAGNQLIELRQKDPATYVFQTNQGVRQAWREFNAADPASGEAAIAATIAAQETLGIPDSEIQPLPKAQADAVAKIVMDPVRPADERMTTLVGIVTQTRNPEHQRAIFRQLSTSGIPASAEVAIDAYMRNDTGAAKRMFEASVLDPEKMPGNSKRETGFDDALNMALFGEDTIGQVVYGLDYMDPAGAQMARRDYELAKSAATMAMVRGMSQEAAITQAVKDIHGDVVRIEDSVGVEGNVLGVVPKDVDQDQLINGMGVAMGSVRTALTDFAQRAMMETIPGVGNDAKAVLTEAMNNNLAATLEEGQFRNYGDGWAFYDPFSNGFVPGPDGKPLMWTTEDFLRISRMSQGAGAGGDGF
jgi:hypothetical protein